MQTVILEAVRIENLRGFYNSSVSLAARRTLIVGPNNCGKTSLLRLLNWALNELDPSALAAGTPPSQEDLDLILPARQTRHRARRLTLELRIPDGRSWTRFGCDAQGRVALRINVRLTPRAVIYVALGSPKQNEPAASKSRAVELLRRLQESITFIHIPSFRDAASDRFGNTLSGAIRKRIEARALHEAQGGAPSEYRKLTQAFTKIEKVVLELAQPLWTDIKKGLPPGLAKDAEILLDCDWSDALTFLESRLCLKVTTGPHDSNKVAMTELGSGLQSLLDLAIQEAEVGADQYTVIAAEEPEAFLHPSAQRVTASRLLGSDGVNQAIITTHSATFIDEARYGDVIIARDHRLYEPVQRGASDRAEINTALLTGHGAEMLFARSILLVEGESDRQFFERLRRRVAASDDSGLVDTCYVVAVGSNTSFAPWIRLLESYGSPGDRPIRWLVATDGDSSREIRRAFADASYQMKQDLLDALGDVTAAKTAGDLATWRATVARVNTLARRTDFPLHLLLLDLEESMLADTGDQTVAVVRDRAGLEPTLDRSGVLAQLGAKGFSPRTDPVKAPWIRGLLGDVLPPRELPRSTRALLLRWFSGSMGDGAADPAIQLWEA